MTEGRKYPQKYKDDAVELVISSGRAVDVPRAQTAKPVPTQTAIVTDP